MSPEEDEDELIERKLKLKSLNSHITCKICKGYFVNATTVTECLHTFCKTCLVKYLEENNTCPQCDIVIHQSHPLQYISHDRTMQDIVYKLVPRLLINETKREQEFYKSRGLPCPSEQPPGLPVEDKPVKAEEKSNNKENNNTFHKLDEQVSLCLECQSQNLKPLKRQFLRTSSQATITHLKKFIAKKILESIDDYKDVDIFCNNELLGKDHTLKFVYVTRWRFKDPPLKLCYKPRMEI